MANDIHQKAEKEASLPLEGSAEAFYQQGNEHRRNGDWQQALNCYLEAIALDPDSPAVEAKQMLDDILDFYHKDSYNP